MSRGAPVAPIGDLRLALVGILAEPEETVKVMPLLARPPTVTTTFPLVAPAGTGAMMLVALQLVGVADIPLKVSVLVPCLAPKFVPVIVTEVPTGPEVGLTLAILGELPAPPGHPNPLLR